MQGQNIYPRCPPLTGRGRPDPRDQYTTTDSAFQTLEDAYGYLWISCSRGVYRVSKSGIKSVRRRQIKQVTSTPYGKVDGMRSNECNGGVWPSGLKTIDGRLWFPTRDGVAVIDPGAVAHDRTPPRDVFRLPKDVREPITSSIDDLLGCL